MKFLLKTLLPVLCAVYVSMIAGEQVIASGRQYLLLGILVYPIARYLFSRFYLNYVEGKPVNKRAAVFGLLLSVLLLGAAGQRLVPRPGSHERAVVTVSPLGDKDPASSSTEVWILAVTNGTERIDLSKIVLDSSWERKPEGIVSYRMQPSKLDIVVEDADHPTVIFLQHSWSGKVKVSDGVQTTVVNLYKPSRSEYVYAVKHMSDITSAGDGIKVVLLHLFTLSFLFALLYPLLAAFMAGARCYYALNWILWAGLFLLQDFVTVTPAETITLFVISCVTAYLFGRAYERRDQLNAFITRKNIIILLLIVLYAGFACVGNAVFVERNDHSMVECLCYWLLFGAWFFSAAVAFLFLLYRLREGLQQRSVAERAVPARPQVLQLWALCFCILTLVWFVYLLAFYPGSMSSDSLDQWGQALGLVRLNNAHPVFHTFFNKLLLLFYQSPAAIAFGQILFMAAVVASFLAFLYKKGIPRAWLLGFAVIFSLLPANGINVITLWKDIPFTVALLWLTLLLAQIAADEAWVRKSWLAFAGLLLALVATALFRHNGMLVYVFAIVGLVYYSIKWKSRAILVCAAASVVGIVAYNVTVLHRRDITPVDPGLALIAPLNGVAAVMHEDSLSPDVEEKMEAILPRQQWIDLYSPYWASAYQFETNGVFVKGLSRLSLKGAAKIYLKTLYHHPGIVIADRLKGSDLLWNVSRPTNARNVRYNAMLLEPNDYGLHQNATRLKPVLMRYLEISETCGEELWWRAGLYNIFILLVMFFIFLKGRRRVLLAFIPWFGGLCSLLPSVAWQDFRYVYFVGFLFGFLLLLALSDNVASETRKE